MKAVVSRRSSGQNAPSFKNGVLGTVYVQHASNHPASVAIVMNFLSV